MPATLTDEEADELLGQVMRAVGGFTDVKEKSFAKFADYIADGGRDRATCQRLLDHLGRQLAEAMTVLNSIQHPLTTQAAAALSAAAPNSPHEGGTREEEVPGAALSLLTGIFTLGRHYLVDPRHWPDALPGLVLAAVRAAGEDPTVIPPTAHG